MKRTSHWDGFWAWTFWRVGWDNYAAEHDIVERTSPEERWIRVASGLWWRIR